MKAKILVDEGAIKIELFYYNDIYSLYIASGYFYTSYRFLATHKNKRNIPSFYIESIYNNMATIRIIPYLQNDIYTLNLDINIAKEIRKTIRSKELEDENRMADS